MSAFAAGWYPDYADPRQQRYWDGDQWTHYVLLPVDEDAPRWRRRRLPKFKPSEQLVGATYRQVFADRSLIVLVFLGSLLAALVGASVLLTGTHWVDLQPGYGRAGLVTGVVVAASTGAATFVFQLVSATVVAAAILRAEGRPVTMGAALRMAWGRKRQLLAWAAVSTLVGAVGRVLERLGVGGFLAAFSINVGWAFATVFATPVIMVEGTMPVATIRRSSSLLRGRFTVLLISSITAMLPWLVLLFGSLGVAVVALAVVIFGSGLVAIVAGAVLALSAAGVSFSLAVTSAVGSTLETYLYRYARGLPVPGVDQHLLPPLRPA
jgi:hypothetical protein